MFHTIAPPDSFMRSGGTLHMVQLWVNLPAKGKMTKPGYQPSPTRRSRCVPAVRQAITDFNSGRFGQIAS